MSKRPAKRKRRPAQAAGATENARLLEETDRRRREAEVVAELARGIGASLELDTVLQRLVESARELTDGDMARIALRDETSQRFVFRHWVGPCHPGWHAVTFEPGRGLGGQVLLTGRSVRTSNCLEDPRIPKDYARLAREEGVVAALAVPVTRDERVEALLFVLRQTPRAFTDRDEEVLLRLADHAAVAIQNARLYAEGAARRRSAEAVAELGRALLHTLDPKIVGQQTADSARTLLGATNSALYRLDETGALVSIAVSGNLGPSFGENVVFPPGTGAIGAAVRTRQPVSTPDVLADGRLVLTADLRSRIEPAGYRSVLSVPLFLKDRVIGALSVGDRLGRVFDEDEIRAMQTFAAQAALALENARLYAEAEQRRREAETLAEISRALTQTLEPDSISQTIADRAVGLFEVRTAVFFEILPDSGDLRALAVAGTLAPDFTGLAFPRANGLAGLAIRERRVVTTADLLGDPRVTLTPEARSRLEAAGIGSGLSAPFIVGDRVVGVLSLGDAAGREFSATDVRSVETLADQAALALQNARLYREAEQRRREIEVTAETAQAIGASLDLDIVLQRITDGAKDLVGSDVAMIGFREADEEAITIRYRVGSRYAPGRTLSIEPGKGLGGQVLLTGRPRRTDDYAADPAFGKEYVGAFRKDGIVTAMAVPIKTEERVVGVLYVSNRSPRRFTDQDERILLRLADSAAIAVKNAQFYARERESEARYRALVEGSLQGVCILHGFATRFANSALARMLGYETPQELTGLDARRWIAPHEISRIEGYAAAQRRDEPAPTRYEFQAVRKDGTLIWADVQVVLITWDGQPAVQVAVSDITERRRAEEALRQQEEQLRQSQKMEAVGRLAGGIAHDFNNLLTVITGRGELLLRRLPAESPVRRDVELIKKTAERAAVLTRQLLAFSRKQMLQPRVLGLNQVVASAAQMLQRLIGEDIDVVTALDPNLGLVTADPAQIEQVIVNLAVNARDAMPSGGRLRIETANVELDDAFVAAHPGASAGAHAMLAVGDTGTGMTPEVQAHIFEPFFTTKEVGKGTGLGLATVYGIVKQHEGYIAVESAPGAGTTLRVYLRRVAEPVERAEPGPAHARLLSMSETVLLVEDENDLRALATEILDDAGYAVLVAGGPGEAMERARRHEGPIHLLLTDVVMPEMSGRDLAERLTPAHPEMKVLYMSGYTADTIGHHGVLDTGTALLQKPFTPDALTRKVREVLTS